MLTSAETDIPYMADQTGRHMGRI